MDDADHDDDAQPETPDPADPQDAAATVGRAKARAGPIAGVVAVVAVVGIGVAILVTSRNGTFQGLIAKGGAETIEVTYPQGAIHFDKPAGWKLASADSRAVTRVLGPVQGGAAVLAETGNGDGVVDVWAMPSTARNRTLMARPPPQTMDRRQVSHTVEKHPLGRAVVDQQFNSADGEVTLRARITTPETIAVFSLRSPRRDLVKNRRAFNTMVETLDVG